MSSQSTDNFSLEDTLRINYGQYLNSIVAEDGDPEPQERLPLSKVAVVGGGMAGLYVALALACRTSAPAVTLFEASTRVGGRIYTHRFSDEEYQYFEAGIQHFPKGSLSKTIDAVNNHLPAESQVKCIPAYKYPFPPDSINRIFVNNKLLSRNEANNNPGDLGFPTNAQATEKAEKLLWDALKPAANQLASTSDVKVWKDYSSMSLRYYLRHGLRECPDCFTKLECKCPNPNCPGKLKEEEGEGSAAGSTADAQPADEIKPLPKPWENEDRINFVELMTSSYTNQFHSMLIEELIERAKVFTGDLDLTKLGDQEASDFSTIEGGMSVLPERLAELIIGKESCEILLQTTVESLSDKGIKGVKLEYSQPGEPGGQRIKCDDVFDAVVLAIPPSAIQQITRETDWSINVEYALRSIRYRPRHKIGLRFHSRFWEQEEWKTTGGHSITDLPSRWVEYPSYPVNEKGESLGNFEGKGILCIHTCMSDSDQWVSKSLEKKIEMALRDLKKLYPKVDVHGMYAGGEPGDPGYLEEAFAMEWGTPASLTGDVNYLPEQFEHFKDKLVKPQGDVFFAGDYLSARYNSISGAIESAQDALDELENRFEF